MMPDDRLIAFFGRDAQNILVITPSGAVFQSVIGTPCHTIVSGRIVIDLSKMRRLF
jgi:hypothetical protein